MIRSLFLAITMATPAFAAEVRFSAKTEKTNAPEEISAAVRAFLAADCVTIRDGEAIVVELWFRADLPASAAAEQIRNGLTYRELPEGTLLAAVRFPKTFTDYRKQDIPAGVYTLRLAFQPVTGDHNGTAPHTEFALLAPAAKDTATEALEVKDLIKLSRQSTGGDHPGVMLLFPTRHAATEPKLVSRDGGVWTVEVNRPVTAEGGKTNLGLALTVSGTSPSR